MLPLDYAAWKQRQPSWQILIRKIRNIRRNADKRRFERRFDRRLS